MKLNLTQKIIIATSILGIALVAVFPPQTIAHAFENGPRAYGFAKIYVVDSVLCLSYVISIISVTIGLLFIFEKH